jgi:hypothetical protein
VQGELCGREDSKQLRGSEQSGGSEGVRGSERLGGRERERACRDGGYVHAVVV